MAMVPARSHRCWRLLMPLVSPGSVKRSSCGNQALASLSVCWKALMIRKSLISPVSMSFRWCCITGNNSNCWPREVLVAMSGLRSTQGWGALASL